MRVSARVSVFSLIGFLIILSPLIGFGMEAKEILVVSNSRMVGSDKLAHYYMERRKIPAHHLLSLPLVTTEVIQRIDYEKSLLGPVREKIEQLKRKQERIEAIVLIYGVPLKISPAVPTLAEREEIRKQMMLLQKINDEQQLSLVERERKRESIEQKINKLERVSWRASVDSELFLVKQKKYSLEGRLPNPYFDGFQAKELKVTKKGVLLVSRLDGPDLKTVYRMIDDSLYAEKNGLNGKGYFDARWPRTVDASHTNDYQLYDLSLYRTADLVGKRIATIMDSKRRLFGPGECPDAALYCGWYSLAEYIDAFAWRRGAIGYHMAGAECGSLRGEKRPLWCRSMLEHGAAATIGPVYKTDVQAFPVPELFFGHLIEGYMSLGEAYLVSLPYISWQMVLIGDPLYQPFAELPAAN